MVLFLALVALVASVQSFPSNSTLAAPLTNATFESALAVNLTKRASKDPCDDKKVKCIQAYDYLQNFLEKTMKGWEGGRFVFVSSKIGGNIADKPSRNVQCIIGIHEEAGLVTNSRVGTKVELEKVHEFFTTGDRLWKKYRGAPFRDYWIDNRVCTKRWENRAKFTNVYEMQDMWSSPNAGRFLRDHCVKAALKSMRYVSSQTQGTIGTFYNAARLLGAFVPLPISTYDVIEAIKDTIGGENADDWLGNHYKTTHRLRNVLCAVYKNGVEFNKLVPRPASYSILNIDKEGVIDYLGFQFRLKDEVTEHEVKQYQPPHPYPLPHGACQIM